MKQIVCFLLLFISSLSACGAALAQTELESRAMTKAGDFTGDGRGDLIILRSVLNLRSQQYTLREIQLVDGVGLGVLHSIIPQAANLREPRAFRLDDVDGDARADIAVTSEATSLKRADSVFVYSGATGQLIRKQRLGKKPVSVLSITRLGDVDGDAVSDFALGTTIGRPEERSVIVYSGLQGRKLTQKKTRGRNQFAQSLATIGDRDLDGLPDLLVGGTPTGNPRGGAYSILSGRTLALIAEERSNDRSIILGDDVHAGVDLDRQNGGVFALWGLHAPEYVVSVLHKATAQHTFRVYDGHSGAFRYTIGISGGSSQLAGMTRLQSRVMDWIADIDLDCIPDAVVVGDDAQVRVFSGDDGSFIRGIASASSFATLSNGSKPYSWLLATSGFSGQRVLDVRTLFPPELRPFCDM